MERFRHKWVIPELGAATRPPGANLQETYLGPDYCKQQQQQRRRRRRRRQQHQQQQWQSV
jgi:hypothetical protein